jgi:hypothetical protein
MLTNANAAQRHRLPAEAIAELLHAMALAALAAASAPA